MLTFDLPGEKVNKFSTRRRRRARRRARAAVPGGADPRPPRPQRKAGHLHRRRRRQGVPDASCPSRSGRASTRVQSLFEQLANLPYPTVAAINGACLGGGTELALACDYRLMSDSKKAQIGLPEVRLGIFPAWGGCTRLPRVVGLPAALDLILTGKTLDARRAKKIGLVDEAVPAAIFDDWSRRFARSKLGGAQARRRAANPGPPVERILEATPFGRQAHLLEGPQGRAGADGRPLPGAARGARGHRGGVRQAGRGRPRGRGAAHRPRLRRRGPEEPARDLLPDGGGQEGDRRRRTRRSGRATSPGWACSGRASWAAASRSSRPTRGCRRA